MATPVLMPLMGMTMEEGIVSSWLVEDGATVTKGQPILEFETDKINATVEAPEDGVLGGIAAQPGDAVPVQGTLAYILEPGEEPPAAEAPPAAAPEPAPPCSRSRACRTASRSGGSTARPGPRAGARGGGRTRGSGGCRRTRQVLAPRPAHCS